MYALLGLYARPYNAQEPVVCVDEKSKQLLRQTRAPIPVQPGQRAHEDYEYKRAGTRNIFVAIEPKGKRRRVEVTARRTKVDFVGFVKNLLETVYATAITVHLVLDNLNTHFRQTIVDVLGEAEKPVDLSLAGTRTIKATVRSTGDSTTSMRQADESLLKITAAINRHIDHKCRASELGRPNSGSDHHRKTIWTSPCENPQGPTDTRGHEEVYV
jgi:hypothetical protein